MTSAELPAQPLCRPGLPVQDHSWRRAPLHSLQGWRHLHQVRAELSRNVLTTYYTCRIRCPIQGPKHFSYNFGRGLCQSPMSALESCTMDTRSGVLGVFSANIVCSAFRISLKYQACPTVPGTEMKGSRNIFIFSCYASCLIFLLFLVIFVRKHQMETCISPFSLRGFFKTCFDLFAVSRLTQQHGRKFKTLKAFYLWCQLCWLDHQCPHVQDPSYNIIQRFAWVSIY